MLLRANFVHDQLRQFLEECQEAKTFKANYKNMEGLDILNKEVFFLRDGKCRVGSVSPKYQ
jgi:hypothetical protein